MLLVFSIMRLECKYQATIKSIIEQDKRNPTKKAERSSCGGLVVERLLHKRRDSATVDPIPLEACYHIVDPLPTDVCYKFK